MESGGGVRRGGGHSEVAEEFVPLAPVHIRSLLSGSFLMSSFSSLSQRQTQTQTIGLWAPVDLNTQTHTQRVLV